MALKNNAPLYSSHFVTTFRGALMPKSVIRVRKKCNISIFCKICYAFSPNNRIFAVGHFLGKNLLQIYVKEIVFSKSFCTILHFLSLFCFMVCKCAFFFVTL